jgi:hypothetical protein
MQLQAGNGHGSDQGDLCWLVKGPIYLFGNKDDERQENAI